MMKTAVLKSDRVVIRFFQEMLNECTVESTTQAHYDRTQRTSIWNDLDALRRGCAAGGDGGHAVCVPGLRDPRVDAAL